MVRLISFVLCFFLCFGCSGLKQVPDISFSSEVKQILNSETKKSTVKDIEGRLKKESKGRISSILLKDVAVEDFIKVVFNEILKEPYILDRSVEKLSKRIDIEIPSSYSKRNLYSVIVALMEKFDVDIEEIEGVTVFSVHSSSSNPSNNFSSPESKNNYNFKNGSENRIKSDCVYTYKPAFSKATDLQKTLKDLITSDQGRVLVQESTNTLLIKSSEKERRGVVRLLKVLDEQQKQIAVDVTIAEVSLINDLSIGFEGFLKNNNLKLGLSTGNKTDYGIMANLDIPEVLNAVMKMGEKRGLIKIKSSPYLLIENGSKSSISIGSEYPVLSNEKSSSETTTTTKAVEYRKTGIILTITPVVTGSDIHVNSTIELSEGRKNELSTLDSPVILTRKIESSVVVQSGQNIIIGGLISESKNDSENVLPWFNGKTIKTGITGASNRTELVIIMQVSVIDENNSKNWFEMLAEKYKEQKIKS